MKKLLGGEEMRVKWDIVLVDEDIFIPHAYFFKKMPHFLWGGESEFYLVVYSSPSVGRYVEPEYASSSDVIAFLLRALEEDSFDEKKVILNPEVEGLRKKLEKWEEEGKVIVAETPPVMLEKPPFTLSELVSD
jgi:hypothetical protein